MNTLVPISFVHDCVRASKNRFDVKPFDYSTLKTDIEKEIGSISTPNPDLAPVNSVLDIMKQTPLVKLSRLTAKHDIKCNLYGKFEALSGGGSIKDRIAVEMITRAEAAGTIKPGDVIIEATSGNTGLGLATVCAVKGYQLVVFMPEKISKEKERTLLGLGAVVYRTPNGSRWFAEDSCVSMARKLEVEINSRSSETGRRGAFLDQYRNSGNVSAHYYGTAEEVLKQLDNKIDALVVGCGTGGTMTGMGSRIKEVVPACKIYGVDPRGSILHLEKNDSNLCPWQVEGIGKDFHPSTFQPNLVDQWFIEDDIDTFNCARELIRTEGLLVGGSSGAALSAAIKIGKTMQHDQNVVVIFPDSVRNYITKFLSDDWMVVHGFLPPTAHPLAESTAEFNKLTIREATASLTLRPFSTLPRFSNTLTVRDLYPKLESGFHCVIYNATTNLPCGLISKADLIPHVLDDRLDKPLSSVAEPQTLMVGEAKILPLLWCPTCHWYQCHCSPEACDYLVE